MPDRRRLTRATALLTLALQLIITAAGAATMCLAMPHEHDGVLAPDCPMHHQPAGAAPAAGGHQHHDHGAALPEGATADESLTCGCSSDLSSFLVGANALLSDSLSVRVPMSRRSTLTAITASTLDLRIPPQSPPPRPTIS